MEIHGCLALSLNLKNIYTICTKYWEIMKSVIGTK